MDAATIKKHIDNDRYRHERNSAYRRYAGGMNPGIFEDAAKDEPDNRIPVPFARKAIKMVKGYMFQSGNITYSGKGFEDSYQPVFEANNEPLLTASEAESALTYGSSFELHWFDKAEGIPYFAEVPIDECIPIYDDTILHKLIGFIRYYYVDNADLKKKYESSPDIKDAPPIPTGPIMAYYYDDKMITEYSCPAKGKDFVEGVSTPHGYGMVPVVEFNTDLKKANLFNHVIPLIDWHDKMVSEDLADELARFAAAYLLLSDQIDNITLDENGRTELDRIKNSKAFTQLGDDVARKVAFLTKDINGSFIKEAMDRAERLIYDQMQVVNPESIESASDPTGEAIKWKFVPFEYLCTDIESVFRIGLERRVKLLYNILSTMDKKPETQKLDIVFRRNLPSNALNLTDIAMKAKGNVSDRTLLKLFQPWLVTDIEEELEQMAKEKEFDFMDDGSDPPPVNDGNSQGDATGDTPAPEGMEE